MHGQLAREFAETAQALQDLNHPQEVLDAIVELAAPTVGCSHVGLLLCGRHPGSGRGPLLRRGQASDAEAAQADQVQIAVRQGPCWSCLARPDGPPEILIDDLTAEQRWPAWNGPVAELGVRSVLTFRLETVDRTVGFLTWYDDTPHGFSPDVISTAHVVAYHAAPPLARALDLDRWSGRRPLTTLDRRAVGRTSADRAAVNRKAEDRRAADRAAADPAAAQRPSLFPAR